MNPGYLDFVNSKLSLDSTSTPSFIGRVHNLYDDENNVSRLLTGAIGQLSESLELCELGMENSDINKIKYELGDVLFYMTISFSEMNLPFPTDHDEYYEDYLNEMYIYEKELFKQLSICFGKYLDILKKVLFQGKPMSIHTKTDLRTYLLLGYKYTILICERLRITIDDVLDANQEKLNNRYVCGFTKLESENRKE